MSDPVSKKEWKKGKEGGRADDSKVEVSGPHSTSATSEAKGWRNGVREKSRTLARLEGAVKGIGGQVGTEQAPGHPLP